MLKPAIIRHTAITAAATAAAVTPSPFHWWRLDQVQLTIVTDATAVTRYTYLEIRDGASLFATLPQRTTTSGSRTEINRYIGYPIATTNIGASTYSNSHPNPPQWFPPGAQIVVKSSNLQAGDSYSDLIISVTIDTELT